MQSDLAAGSGEPQLGNTKLFTGPAVDHLELDFGILNAEQMALLCSGQANTKELELLPDDQTWRADEDERPVVPLPLSEFLAYKSALAYEDEDTIRHTLDTCCDGITHFQFFDSAKSERRVGDTQGYGFVYQGKAFIIMRGTTSGTDWRGNLNDRQTTMLSESSKELKQLGMSIEELLKADGGKGPGRHLGFSIGWAVVRAQIDEWIEKIAPTGAANTFVFAGHSLGGALAFIGAYEFANTPSRHVGAVVTFGAPIAGGNEFATHYDELLGDRTVRFEADGDSVPLLMQRWYYRLYTRLRQFRQKLSNRRKKTDLPKPVGLAWQFAAQPPLTRSNLDFALKNAVHEYNRRQKEREKEEQDGEKPEEAENKAERTKAQTKDRPARRESGTKQRGTSPDKPTKEGDDSRLVIIVVGVVAFAVVALIAWIFVKKKLASHNIQERYALYLSTLSYQRIRQLRPNELMAAHEDLERYQNFIRGNLQAADASVLSAVRDLPVRLNPDDKIDYFLLVSDEHIA